jgi:Undecaprenyl-phosphate galactose phosphotransferase WbaP
MWRVQQPSTLRTREAPASSSVASLLFPPLLWQEIRSPWWPRMARIGILLLTDMLALVVAAAVGYLLWAQRVLLQSPALYADLLPLLWLFPLGYAGMGLYPGFGVGAVETFRRLSYCTSFAFLVLAASGFALKLPPDYSRMTFVIAWWASLVTVPLWRFLVLSVVSRWRWWGEPTVLIGSGPWVQWAIRALGNAVSLGYRPVGVLMPDRHRYEQCLMEGVPVFGGAEMVPYLAERGVRVALVEVGEHGIDGSILSRFQQHFRHVVVIREVQDLPIERVRVCNLGGILGIEFTNDLLRWQNRCIKRLLDLALGVIFCMLALPGMVVGGCLVKLLSRGPFLFCQMREGLGGYPIKVWKLRTMYRDAEQRLESFLAANPALRREWEERFKLARDPRIIPVVGTVLRRLSVDELPQLWSVITGEMSLVGPRPFPEYHLRQFPMEFRELRQRVRPGVTGLWQVMVRSDGGIDEQQLYDTYYIRNWSIWLDLWILFRTIRAVLLGKGAR